MTNTAMLKQIEKYWAAELGFAADLLHRQVAIAAARSDNSGAFIFRHRNCYVWHVPERFLRKMEQSVQTTPDASLFFQESALQKIFGPAAQRILGPCPIAYCDSHSLRLRHDLPINRLLTETDRASLQSLASACGTEAWEHGGVEFDKHKAVFGSFNDGQLVSAASYEIWGDVIAHIGVATAPTHRGHGHAQSAAGAAAHHALSLGLVPQWRTLASNLASVAVGRSLGFTPWATHFYVRLGEADNGFPHEEMLGS